MCPYCRQEGFGSVLNKAMIREIKEFNVKCSNHEKGCDWVGELGDSEEHIKSNAGCGYEMVKCNKFGFTKFSGGAYPPIFGQKIECGEQCERRFLANHQVLCKFRRCKCKFCDHVDTFDAIAGSGEIHLDQSTVNAHSGSNHYAVCGQYPVKCPNNCGEKAIKRSDIPRHRELCPLEPVNCPFENVGCTLEILQCDMDSHCQTNMHTHLLLMIKSHNELLRKNKELECKNQELNRQHQNVIRRLEALECRNLFRM